MLKKGLIILMTGIMVFSFTACSNAKETGGRAETTSEAGETENEEAATNSAGETESKTESAGDAANGTAISLTEEEQKILEMMGEDVIAVTDEDYASVVEELQYHTGEFNGKVYQLEGTYSQDSSASFVSRTLVHDGEETTCGLPLVFLEKEIEDGAWIRITGIVNEGEVKGQTVNVLEVVAIEVLQEEGKAVLEWDGSAHEH